MQEIISVSWSHDPERENRLSLLFSLFLCELSRLEAQKSSLTPIDPMIEEIIRLIHSTPQTFFTAGEIASRYYICERTLNNRFHKYCKKTFPAFQMETKLEMVRQFLLTQPDTKLREAAINYGFCDESTLDYRPLSTGSFTVEYSSFLPVFLLYTQLFPLYPPCYRVPVLRSAGYNPAPL